MGHLIRKKNIKEGSIFLELKSSMKEKYEKIRKLVFF